MEELKKELDKRNIHYSEVASDIYVFNNRHCDAQLLTISKHEGSYLVTCNTVDVVDINHTFDMMGIMLNYIELTIGKYNKDQTKLMTVKEEKEVGLKYDDGKTQYNLFPKDLLSDYISDLMFEKLSDTDKIVYLADANEWYKVLILVSRLLTKDTNIAIKKINEVLTYGANKYAPGNWKFVEPDRYKSAFFRHFNAFYDGESRDEESGLLHLAHAMCNAMFLTYLLEEK